MGIDRCFNVADFRRLAQRRLPAAMFHYIDGGSDDELTLRRNTAAFNDVELMPRVLVDVSTIDTRTRLFGTTLSWPVFLSPTGMSRLFHHGRELAVARAAARTETLYSLSTLATTSIEDVATANPGPKLFQVYILKDRGLTRDFVQRCKAANYTGLCLTVDAPLAGNRERDYVHGMTMPPKFGFADIMSFMCHFNWSINFIRDPDFRLANIVHRVDAIGRGTMPLMQYMNSQFDRSITWRDVEWLRGEWDGPLVIKGLQAAADARAASAAGATAVMISNHGGRQLETAPAPFDCIAAIRDAVGDSLELICDGGIRRGTHVLKALARGANACSMGRPYLYGLAAGGQAGVERVIRLLQAEIQRDMALMGARTIAEIDGSFLVSRQAVAAAAAG
jgi:L-lactate dehydrogenase (cytochrome)